MAFTYNAYQQSDDVKKKQQEAEEASTYNKSSAVRQAENALSSHLANKPAEWDGGTLQQDKDNIYSQIANRKAFSYDLNGDALYQQYKNQYMTQGKLAMADTMGQAASMTGGYGNSYAATAGNQAYQSYLSQLNDVVPELYQMAYSKYQQEGEDLQNLYSLASDRYNTAYNEHRDAVSDYNTETNRLTDRVDAERDYDYNQFTTERAYKTSVAQDARDTERSNYDQDYSNAYNAYQSNLSEQQADQSSEIANYKFQLESIQARESINSIEYDPSSGKYILGGVEYDSYDDAVDAVISAYDTLAGDGNEQYANAVLDAVDFNSESAYNSVLDKIRAIKVNINTTGTYDDKRESTMYESDGTQYGTYADAVKEVLRKYGSQLTETQIKKILQDYGV